MFLKVKKLSETAKTPYRHSNGDAGYDLFANEECIITSKCVTKVKTGVCIQITKENNDYDTYAGFIYDRSSLGSKGIGKLAGLIDEGYTGEIVVCLTNHGQYDHMVRVGDKIAQIVFQKVETPYILELDRLNETERGEKGFGSSGS